MDMVPSKYCTSLFCLCISHCYNLKLHYYHPSSFDIVLKKHVPLMYELQFAIVMSVLNSFQYHKTIEIQKINSIILICQIKVNNMIVKCYLHF